MDPEYPRLTREVLTAAVAKNLDVDAEEVKVEKLDITGGSADGENYQGILKMIAVTALVRGQQTVAQYVVKFMVMDPQKVARMRQAGAFDTECAMYTAIFPALTKLDPEIGLPRVMYGNNEKIVIIMENLKLKGYYIPDMVTGMDEAHAKAALEWLARFHAASFHFLNTFQGGLDAFAQKFKTLIHADWVRSSDLQMKLLMRAFLTASDRTFKAIIRDQLEDSEPDLVRRVQRFPECTSDELVGLHNANGTFNCLLHNDAWTNNFLFKKLPTGELATKAIDFQMCRRARPTIDVAYLLWTSTQPTLRKECESRLLDHYYDMLVKRLESFGYDKSIYPRDNFDSDYLECSKFGYQISQMHTLLHLTPADAKEGKLDFKELSADKEQVKDYFTKFARAQLNIARTDERMRERHLAIAREAARLGLI